MIKFMIPIDPRSVQHGSRARVVRGKFCGMYNDADKVAYIDTIVEEVKHYAPPEPMLGPLEVFYIFFLRRPETVTSSTCDTAPCDWDNLVKSCQDSLSKKMGDRDMPEDTAIKKVSKAMAKKMGELRFWNDDRQVIHGDAWKIWACEDLFPRIEVLIRTPLPGSIPVDGSAIDPWSVVLKGDAS